METQQAIQTQKQWQSWKQFKKYRLLCYMEVVKTHFRTIAMETKITSNDMVAMIHVHTCTQQPLMWHDHTVHGPMWCLVISYDVIITSPHGDVQQ